eukprot:11579375-Alexandrium_andersonii.AAC.1
MDDGVIHWGAETETDGSPPYMTYMQCHSARCQIPVPEQSDSSWSAHRVHHGLETAGREVTEGMHVG